MVRAPLASRWVWLLGGISVLVLLLGYSWISHGQQLENPNDTTIPSLAAMLDGLQRAALDEDWLWVDTKATGYRLGVGLLISVVGSVLVGVLMSSLSALEALLLPPLTLAAKVVPTAALAVFFALVGTGTELYITMIVFGISPALTLSIYLAAKAIPVELIDKAYTLGASHMEVIWGVVFPAVVPQIIDAIRLAVGPAMVYLIAAELYLGDEGYGYRIRLLSRRLEMDVVYPYIMLLAGFGFGIDVLLTGLRKQLCPWYVEG